jgi:hypothetical protein
VLLLKCIDTPRMTDDQGRPFTLLCTEVVLPEETDGDGLVSDDYRTANWWELPERYVVSGPLVLSRHSGGANLC